MELLSPSVSLIIWSALVFFLGFWVFALVDVSRRDFEGRNEKMLWGLMILFIPVLGTILYFAIGRKKKAKLKHF